MIVCDDRKIVVQHRQSEAPDYKYKDGGDSAGRTGPLSRWFRQHRKNMPLFVVKVDDHYELVRHPDQDTIAEGAEYAHNDPRATSRDLVIMWAVGVDEDSTQEEKDCCLHYAQKGWVNKDFLEPSVRLYLWQKSGYEVPLWLKLLGYPNLAISVLWNSFMAYDLEANQFTCMVIHFGKAWSWCFYKFHPNLEENIREYFAPQSPEYPEGWRDQSEIGVCLILDVKSEAGLMPSQRNPL